LKKVHPVLGGPDVSVSSHHARTTLIVSVFFPSLRFAAKTLTSNGGACERISRACLSFIPAVFSGFFRVGVVRRGAA
jgi:hypothetical protein